MIRHNIFLPTNKGFRHELCQVSVRLQHADLALSSAAPVIGRMERLLLDWISISRKVRTGIGPLPGTDLQPLMARLDREHHMVCRHCHDLLECAGRWRAHRDTAQRRLTGSKLCYDFNDLVAIQLRYMSRQEQGLMAALSRVLTRPQLKDISIAVVRSLTEAELLEEGRRIALAVPARETVQWLSLVCRHISNPLLLLLSGYLGATMPTDPA